MDALRVARRIVAQYGSERFLTNLKINLLVYWCQVEALRANGQTLFTDDVAVGERGPIEPAVWDEYAPFGSRMIRQRDEWQEAALDASAQQVVARVVDTLGALTAIDLLSMSNADDGAWRRAKGRGSAMVDVDDILTSADMRRTQPTRTLAGCVDEVTREYPNALRLLENS
ncbi:type II toxin-antitoxin system antitoxin SocA domain-containing protein [uncultured Bifidobacterium sp.]|uniref:type II toxin-antitoxin system antitoxin SocA domain-containing protein n=1 Tax=uncultured Bifidobacterium sp. TaxID=165187 RepID=UPI00259A3BEB|nr:type II toxin-antitoxin system antitoxin SocA domain-containing protein [uncultured Bifidobacterium sp.]